jgi:hypothetical protein
MRGLALGPSRERLRRVGRREYSPVSRLRRLPRASQRVRPVVAMVRARPCTDLVPGRPARSSTAIPGPYWCQSSRTVGLA